MSEGGAEGEEYEEAGRPLGLYVLVGVIVALVAISGMFAIGYIPPVLKLHHGSGTTSSLQFLTVTSTDVVTGPGNTVTQTLQGANVTSVSTSTATQTLALGTTTTTATTTQTVTTPVLSTTTVSTTVIEASTSTVTSTVTKAEGSSSPLQVNFTVSPAGNPLSLDAGEYFSINVNINNTQSGTQSFITAYQLVEGNEQQVLSFYPAVPESVQPVVGTSSYILQGSVSPNAASGEYQLYVQVSSVQTNSTAITQTTVSRQYIARVLEPLNFVGYSLPGATSQFDGSCANTPFINASVPQWGYLCKITAAPQATQNMTFTVSNAANVPICIQTSYGGGSFTGFVNMNPYPFCPDGETGVLVPASSVFTFTYTMTNAGQSSGTQFLSFTFQRES